MVHQFKNIMKGGEQSPMVNSPMNKFRKKLSFHGSPGTVYIFLLLSSFTLQWLTANATRAMAETLLRCIAAPYLIACTAVNLRPRLLRTARTMVCLRNLVWTLPLLRCRGSHLVANATHLSLTSRLLHEALHLLRNREYALGDILCCESIYGICEHYCFYDHEYMTEIDNRRHEGKSVSN